MVAIFMDAGSVFIRYSNGHMKSTYCELKQFRDHFQQLKTQVNFEAANTDMHPRNFLEMVANRWAYAEYDTLWEPLHKNNHDHNCIGRQTQRTTSIF